MRHLYNTQQHILRPTKFTCSPYYSTILYSERTIENIFRHSGENRVGLSSFLVFLNHLRIIIAFPTAPLVCS